MGIFFKHALGNVRKLSGFSVLRYGYVDIRKVSALPVAIIFSQSNNSYLFYIKAASRLIDLVRFNALIIITQQQNPSNYVKSSS
jgi:hypothetical protein